MTFYALWLIDCVGLVGIGAILWMSKSTMLKQHDFIEGFTAGAIALHIFVTQLILAFLKPLIVKGDKVSQDSLNQFLNFNN